MKRKLNQLIYNKLEFGDYFLYQKYIHEFDKETNKYKYKVSKPIMAMFLQWWPCDQTLDAEYLVWLNGNKCGWKETAEGVRWMQEPAKIETFAEWMDYGDLLGLWKHKPSWKEILPAYRNMNHKDLMLSDEINWK